MVMMIDGMESLMFAIYIPFALGTETSECFFSVSFFGLFLCFFITFKLSV